MTSKQNNLGALTFGLDIGIASVGWAVLAQNQIVDMGVRAFDAAEDKDGKPRDLPQGITGTRSRKPLIGKSLGNNFSARYILAAVSLPVGVLAIMSRCLNSGFLIMTNFHITQMVI